MISGVADTVEKRAWRRASASVLAHHRAPCCERARGWLLATARSFDFAATDQLGLAAPRWLTERYTWGPTKWPITWCEAVRAEAIDCGVFAAFAREIFVAKGVEAFPGQVLRRYVPESTAHWRTKWAALPGAFDWIGDDVVYHEVCVVRTGDAAVRVYDPTDGFWLDPRVSTGHAASIAIRAEVPRALSWGAVVLVNGQWAEVAGG